MEKILSQIDQSADTTFIPHAWYWQIERATKRGTTASPTGCHLLGLLVDPFWIKNPSGYPIAISTEWKDATLTLTPDLWNKYSQILYASVRVLKEEFELLAQSRMIEVLPQYSAESVAKLLQSKRPQKLCHPCYNQCQWCKGETFVLHEHHYPIPKSKGGTDTVSICPNCHSEFHALVDSRRISLTSKVFENIGFDTYNWD